MAIYSRSSVQNLDNWWIWIRKKKRVASFDRGTKWYWQNLFIWIRFKWTKVWIFDQKTWTCRNKIFQWSKCIYWVFKYNRWHLSKYWWLQHNRQRKILIVFDDMITDITLNKKFQAIIKELFIRSRKLNISLVFITQSYFSVLKDVRLNSTL